MRISDWSSDVCSSYLRQALALVGAENSWMPLSVSPARTLASLLSLIPPMAMLYFTTQLTVRDRSRLLGLLSALALLSVVVGVLQLVSGNGNWFKFYGSTNYGLDRKSTRLNSSH